MKVLQILEDGDTFKNLIKQHCPKNYELIRSGKAIKLFRNTAFTDRIDEGYKAEYSMNYKRPEPRSSITKSNLINSYVSYSPNWKSVPPRATSYFTTTSYEHAKMFIDWKRGSDVNLVIPFDDVNLFATSHNDFNYLEVNDSKILDINEWIGGVFGELKSNMDFNVEPLVPEMNTINKIFGLKIWSHSLKSTFSMVDIAEFSKALKRLQDATESFLSRYNHISDFNYALKSKGLEITAETNAAWELTREFCDYGMYGPPMNLFNLCGSETFLQILNRKLTPKKLGIQTVKSITEITNFGKNTNTTEIWFDGGFIGIHPVGGDFDALINSKWFQELLD